MTHVTQKPAVTAFPLPPEGFDPLTASDATLRHHGIHPRPDAKKFPLLARRWEEVYSKKVKYIQPEFRHEEGHIAGSIPPLPPPPVPSIDETKFWSGSVVQTTALDPIRFLYAKFNVAAVHIRNLSLLDYVDSWLGIGGYPSGALCRAGVRQMVKQSNGAETPTYSVFMQWGAGFWIPTAFQVGSDDMIELLVCVSNSPATEGYFTINNQSRLTQMNFSFVPPAGETINNVSAEWIVSRPESIIEGTQIQPAIYGIIDFQDAFAYTMNGHQLDVGSGTLLSFKDFGYVASAPTVLNPNNLLLTSLRV